MDACRFFRISDAAAYESTRLSLDAARQMPHGETTYEPLATAPRNANGDAMLSIRSAHCELPDIAHALSLMLANVWGVEITASEYWQEMPTQENV